MEPDAKTAPRAPRRARLIAAATTFGLLAGILSGEILFRLWLARQFRGSVTLLSGDLPGEEQVLTFADLLKPDPDPRITYRVKPGLRGYFARARIETNERGFRGAWPAAGETGEAFRIVGIGDSTMFGWGVGEGENYMDLLGAAFGNATVDGEPVEFFNLAQPGYTAVQESALFMREGLPLKPDVVLLQCDINDATPSPFLLEPDFTQPDDLYLRFLPDLMRGRLQAPDGAFMRRIGSHGTGMADAISGWDNAALAYAELAAACQEAGAAASVVIPPLDTYDNHPRLVIDPEYDRIRRICHDAGLPVIETLEEVKGIMRERGMTNSDLVFDTRFNRHLTPLGHRVMAGILRDRLVRDHGIQNAAQIAPESPGESDLPESQFLIGWRGAFDPVPWDGVPVRWSEASGEIRVRRIGSLLWVRYFMGNPDTSETAPITVRFEVMKMAPVVCRHVKRELYEIPIELGPADGSEVSVRFSVEPTFEESPGGRRLGVAFYPLIMTH